MRHLVLFVALLATACMSREEKEARRAAEEYAKTPEVRQQLALDRARVGLPPGDLSPRERQIYDGEITRQLDTLLLQGDRAREKRKQLYRAASIDSAMAARRLDEAKGRADSSDARFWATIIRDPALPR